MRQVINSLPNLQRNPNEHSRNFSHDCIVGVIDDTNNERSFAQGQHSETGTDPSESQTRLKYSSNVVLNPECELSPRTRNVESCPSRKHRASVCVGRQALFQPKTIFRDSQTSVSF